MNYKETFKEAWQLTEEGMNSGMADWRFYAGAVICIGAILLTHLFVYRFPDLLVPFIVALALSGVLIALDVLTERGAATGRSHREGAAVLAVGHFRQLVLSPAGVKGNYPCSRLN